MPVLIVLLTLAAYGLAVYLWWRENTPIYLIALLAGQLGTLLAPLWQVLYRFNYNPAYGKLLSYLGQELPSIVLFGGWLVVLPALVVFYLHRERWWFPSYATGLLTFVVFVVYFLLAEAIGARLRIWSYNGAIALPLGLPVTLLSALMNGLVSLGTLSLLLLTRRYAITSLLMILLPTPLILSLFVNGLLGAPLYTVLLLQSLDLASGWATVIGALGTLGLLAWATHTIASVIESQQGARRAAA